MGPLLHSLLLALSATSTLAQDQITWGSVIFTYHGEKTPFLSRGSHHLTPLGATQLHDAGSAIRSRYVSKPENSSSITEFMPIKGISRDTIQNSQLDVLALDDEYQAASALAFMQGLYPPRRLELPIEDEENTYAPGDSLIQYPLDGYQYPNIETVSELDLSYIW
jgi:hypothetical protein